MHRYILWLLLLVIWISYFLSSDARDLNKSIQFICQKGNVESKLALIPSSPRWKYPSMIQNANIVSNEFIFPYSTLPIISIKIDKNDFFAYKEGIYIRGISECFAKSNDLSWWDWPANYKNKGKDWERKASISFSGFKLEIPSQEIGIRINGNATRAFPQKSLRLNFSHGIKNYFFNNLEEINLSTLILRNAGNDWDRAFMRDVLSNKLSRGLAIETQDAVAVNVYLNGEYWGIHYLRPKIDDDFLSSKYRIDKSDISIIESPYQIYKGDSVGYNELSSLIEFISSNDLTDSSNFSYVCKQIDIESFYNYLAVEIFIANTDWPQNNWMIWKDNSGKFNQGKWKWVLKDTDYGLGFYSDQAYNEDMILKINSKKGFVSQLFKACMRNKNFKNELDAHLHNIIQNQWNEDNFNQTTDSIATLLMKEMPKQINRWRSHLSVNSWLKEVENLKTYYYNKIDYLKRKENKIEL